MDVKELCANPGPPFLQPLNRKEIKYPFFVKADFSSLLFLFFDNLSSLLGILLALLDVGRIIRGWAPGSPGVAEWDAMIFGRVVPGIGIAIMVGNLWYAWMAFKLAAYEKRTDVTALPYGINTPAGFLTAFSIMLPVGFKYFGETDMEVWADKSWKAAASATFIGGLFEIAGAWIGPFIARLFSRAALWCPVGCVGFVWLGMVPFIAVMREPIIGILPLAITFVGFFGNRGLGFGFLGIPHFKNISFVFIVGFGVIFKWAGLGKFNPPVDAMWATVKQRWDDYAGLNKMGPFISLGGMTDLETGLTIVFPVALQSFIETMENIELAAQKGDQYNMREAMIADGMGTCLGACFGAVLPTTCYIGHSRHKKIGATAGYSIVNAFLYLILCNSGLFGVISALVDDVSVGCSLIAVGLIIMQDAIEYSHPRHIPAFCCGLFFVIADPWNFDMRAQDTTYCTRSTARMQGIKNMWPGGGIMCSIMVTQILCDLIDAKFLHGAAFSFVSIFLSLFGLMHGNNTVKPNGENFNNPGEGELTIATMDGTYTTGLNDGYRFCIMYTILFIYMIAHAAVQMAKPDWMPPIAGLGFTPTKDDPDGVIKKAPDYIPDDEKPPSKAVAAEAVTSAA